MKKFVPLLALFAAATAFLAPATAAADAGAAYVDLNGDRRIDRVTVKQAPDNEFEQILTATVNQTTYVTRRPFYAPAGVGAQPLRVSDLDRDGRQEVTLTESVGANTLKFTVWGLDNGWQPVRKSDGFPLELWEGGGISSVNRYGCKLVNGHREILQVSGVQMDPSRPGIHDGALSAYRVDHGIATQTSSTPVSGDRATLEAMVGDPRACA